MRRIFAIVALLLAFAVPALAAGPKDLPDKSYKKVSELVPIPDFIPGVGTLYVNPSTLPVGPFVAYNKEGKMVSTIYMVPLSDMEAHKDFTGLAVTNKPVKKVDITFNGGHPGLAAPHYHVTLWHVDPASAKVK
ncbi:hypothetical protein LPW11_12955 [Geomonas sp. RF6]|uniref:hypothetical protein n=1 Tax=Geomonas sp. RF6 TaxID=2897342 RepID=UPI001E4FF2DB|nr:hypothetical protein [Geomonas sp. RF6]UFS68807.1 hypothetical protein LPW11_12955 [Geomonas sp. RF6]